MEDSRKSNLATNNTCFFYDESYSENCSACKICDCENCKYSKPKNDKREIKLQAEFREIRNLIYYPTGNRR